MSEALKKKLGGIAIVVAVIIAVVWMIFNGGEHIEDTNGADNYELAEITDEQIEKCSVTAIGIGRSKNNLTHMVKFSSNKFSGVYEVLWTDVVFSTGFPLDILNFKVDGGNFKMVIINDGKIIRELTPEDEFPMDLGELSGEVKLVIAGESADFSFEMVASEYDSYGHHE